MITIPKTLLLSAVAALTACASDSAPPPSPNPGSIVETPAIDVSAVPVQDRDSGLDPKWHKSGAFMQIFVRTYHDSDGDGVGDLKGVTQKLDYLKDLGVTGIWLMPVTESSEHDHGYTTSNYRKVEPEYGTEADLKQLVQEAHKRGIGIILDYAMNHSDSHNPLFLNSSSSRTAQYRDWFVWQDSAPDGWVNFSGGSPWTTVATGAYYSLFWARMADFNLRNPDVVEYHKNNLRYWLNLGVDGFRFDAVGTLIENGPGRQFNQPENYALMREIRTVVNEYSNRYIVCEDPGRGVEASSQAGCHSGLAIGSTDINFRMRRLAQGELDHLQAVANYPLDKPGRIGMVLANHDLFAGRRLMNEFNRDETAYRLAAATYLTMSGIPFVYYGEEVGQEQMPVTDPTSDWPQRGPMSWADTPSVTRNTVIGPYPNYFVPAPNIQTHNVAKLAQSADSLLNFYKNLLNLRKASPALRMGDYRVLKVTAGSSIIERRTHNESVIVAINYSATPETVDIAGVDSGLAYESELAFNAAPNGVTVSNGQARLTLPGRSVQILGASFGDRPVYKGRDLFIRGDMNGWAAVPAGKLNYVSDGIYEVEIDLGRAQVYYFKVSTDDWSTYNFGGATAADQSGKSADATGGGVTELEQVNWDARTAEDTIRLDITAPGRYLFRIDARDALNPSIRVVPAT